MWKRECSLRRSALCRAFTMVELLVVIAIVTLLVSLLLPALASARRFGIITKCLAYQRSLSTMFTQYYADCKEFVPTVMAPHNENLTNAYFLGGTSFCALNTNDAGSKNCPENPDQTFTNPFPRIYPTGMGWFFYMGYAQPLVPNIPATSRLQLGMWMCPGTPNYVPGQAPLPQTREYGQIDFTKLTVNLYKRTLYTGVNPQGGSNYHEQPSGTMGWNYRGVFKSATTPSRRVSNWKSDDAILVCHEWTTQPQWGGFLDCHDEGLNILFFDGHAKFGAKRINGIEPYIYYSIVSNGYSLSQADGTAGTGSNNGYAYAGTNGTVNLWNYYSAQ